MMDFKQFVCLINWQKKGLAKTPYLFLVYPTFTSVYWKINSLCFYMMCKLVEMNLKYITLSYIMSCKVSGKKKQF